MNFPVRFHRRIPSDLKEILEHYEQEAGTGLADDFYRELMTRLEIVGENPKFFPVHQHGVRRANLNRFPYHFLYEIRSSSVWVLVLRHDKRNPTFGLRRK